jgi:hypothetical protein
MPTETNGYFAPSSPLVTTLADSVLDSASGDSTYGEFQTLDLFDLSGLTFLPGTHSLDIVAYDVANNRVEERIAFTLE